MSKEKTEIEKILANKLSNASEYVYEALFFAVDQERLKEAILLRLDKEGPSIGNLAGSISIEDFNSYIHTPQVSDVINCYLSYCLLLNIAQAKEKRTILKEDVYTYLLKTIETHYPRLSEEKTIGAIRMLFDSVINICSQKFEINVYSKFLSESGTLDRSVFGIISERYFKLEKNPVAELSRKMTEMMSVDVIPLNSTYERAKNAYNKGIQQYYQNGFIYLLGEYRFREFYIPPRLTPAHAQSYRSYQQMVIFTKNMLAAFSDHEQWRNIFCQQDIIYIIGGAGYGKSLFLKNIINNISKLNIENAAEYLLIFCDLKSFLADGDSKKSIPDLFLESMIKHTGLDSLTKDFIQYYLRIGRCIVLLDALDEVPKRGRRELHKKILAFFRNYNPNNKICITSRDRGFIPEENIEALEILPLTPDDIVAYIDKMILLKKFKKEDKPRFLEQAQTLIEKDFLNNFLVLSLMVNIYKAEKDLPENKIDLYKKCFEYIAKKREEEKSKSDYDWKTINPLMKDSTFISLAVLAAPNNHDIPRNEIEDLLLSQYKTKYVDEATTENAIQEFLEFCSHRTELLVPASVDDRFKFFHRSFFEYFYSRYIYQQSDIQKMYDLMAEFDIDSEVFELTVALVKEENEEKYQKLITFIFDKVKEEFDSSTYTEQKCTAFGILTLAMQVVDDAYFIKQYYNIIIQYNRLMSHRLILEMNQSLICMWIEEYCKSEEDQSEFIEIYKKQFAQYVLSAISGFISTSEDELLFIRTKNYLLSSEGKNIGIRFPLDRKNLPFYVILCGKFRNIHRLLDDCISKGLESIVASGVDRKTKKAIKKGYYAYLKMSEKKKDAFISSLLPKK